MNIFFDILQSIIYNNNNNINSIINPSKQNSFIFFLQGSIVKPEYSDVAVYLHTLMYKMYYDIRKMESKHINKLISKINPTYNLKGRWH